MGSFRVRIVYSGRPSGVRGAGENYWAIRTISDLLRLKIITRAFCETRYPDGSSNAGTKAQDMGIKRSITLFLQKGPSAAHVVKYPKTSQRRRDNEKGERKYEPVGENTVNAVETDI